MTESANSHQIAAGAGHTALPDHARTVAAALAEEIRRGGLDLPLPGKGRTWQRWERLRDLGRRDLSLARLAEGHTDAVAILDELHGPDPGPGTLWGVWAAHPPGPDLHARRDGGKWRVDGVKRFCSGARICTHGLVSALVEGEGRRLFAVLTDTVVADPRTWAACGMTASDTLTLVFDAVPAEPVGAPGDYIGRPGFHHGGIGVAACWYGGALALARPLVERAAAGRADAHALARMGAVDRDLHAAEAVLRLAAHEIDADPHDLAGGAARRTLRARAVVAATCASVLADAGSALGAGPLAADPEYARACADLPAYLSQHQNDRALETLGSLATNREKETANGHGNG
ncbi:acyl-CoA dehydrogenase family protein [Nocardiopsis ansamitocini]|uniref:Acyl-CoA dehydrogenase n=1 Tax=Nocardiopsis ansamitocini TaxID=1670832 RepID=A0A9W6P7P7_9ACTN|nr:acyl-CoA dehydrogenase family protein [Nocardiopsis ansamitocini]GLU48582.1 acyl-CoA dehydrogenase [Nocardiopsis ansamitocini]